jgi:hypothetical protein
MKTQLLVSAVFYSCKNPWTKTFPTDRLPLGFLGISRYDAHQLRENVVSAMGAVKTFTLKMKLAKKIKQNRWGSTHVKNGTGTLVNGWLKKMYHFMSRQSYGTYID